MSINIPVQEPTNLRIIIPAVEVVQTRFGVVVISTIAEGVCFAYGFRLRAADAHQFAPAVVDIADDLGSAAVQDADDVPLAVADIVILTIAPLEPEHIPAFVVVVVGLYVTGYLSDYHAPIQEILRRYTVDRLTPLYSKYTMLLIVLQISLQIV